MSAPEIYEDLSLDRLSGVRDQVIEQELNLGRDVDEAVRRQQG